MENACRICGSTSGDTLLSKRRGEFFSTWSFCEGCRSAHIDPYPTEVELLKYYNSNYLGMDLQDGVVAGVSHQIRFSDVYKQTVFDEYRYSCVDVGLDIKTISNSSTQVLDYGCAHGIFLDWLALNGCLKNNLHGFDVGVDMVSKAIEKGYTCTANIDEFDNYLFDLITLWDVIEHVSHPRDVAKKVKSLLKVGGKVLVQTPNFGELAIHMGDAFAHYLVVEHLHLFSRKALIELFQSVGFVCLSQASFGANAFIKHVAEPYKTTYDKLSKKFDFGATQVLLFQLEG